MILTIALILALVGFDQLSKYYVASILVNLGETKGLIDGIIGLRYVHNYGASFSILQGKQVFLIVFTGIALLFLLYLLFAKKFKSKWEVASFILIVSGGIGNLIDRIAFGYVRDFLDLQFMNFAVFNVADCFVCVGVAMFIVYTIIAEVINFRKSKKQNG